MLVALHLRLSVKTILEPNETFDGILDSYWLLVHEVTALHTLSVVDGATRVACLYTP